MVTTLGVKKHQKLKTVADDKLKVTQSQILPLDTLRCLSRPNVMYQHLMAYQARLLGEPASALVTREGWNLPTLVAQVAVHVGPVLEPLRTVGTLRELLLAGELH